MLLTSRQKKIRDSLISEAIQGNFEGTNNYDSDVQKVLKSELPSNIQKEFEEDLPNPCTTSQFIAFQENQKEIEQKVKQKIESTPSGLVMQEAKGSNDPNVKKIQDLLYCAVQESNLQRLHDILNSNPNSDVQKVLKSKISNNYTISDFAILKQEGDIIQTLWQKADEKTRILFSDSAIKLAHYSSDFDVEKFIPEVKNYNRKYTEKATKRTCEESHQKNDIRDKAIQKAENLGRIGTLHCKLCEAINSLKIEKVKAVLEDCGTNLAMILNRPIHSQSEIILLLYPLYVGLNKRYTGDGKRLKQEDLSNIKEITKLLWDKASPDIRDLWLKNQRAPENQDAVLIKLLKGEQQRHAKIGSEKWLEDVIQEVKDYAEQKSIKENCEIATEKPTTKCVLQDAQLSRVSTNRACYTS